MGKFYVTNKVNNTYKDIIWKLFQDMGRDIIIYVRSGHNDAIPWDDVTDTPQDHSVYSDESAWYTYDSYTISKAVVLYPSDMMIVFSAGAFDANDVSIMCRLTDVLVDKNDPEGQTYFDLEGLSHVEVDGNDYVKKGVSRKLGLTDLYTYDVTLTRKAS